MKEIEIESIKKVGIQTTNPEVRNPFVSNIHFQKTLNQRMTYLWFEHHKLWLLKRHGTSKIISHDLDCLMCCDCHGVFCLSLFLSLCLTSRSSQFNFTLRFFLQNVQCHLMIFQRRVPMFLNVGKRKICSLLNNVDVVTNVETIL